MFILSKVNYGFNENDFNFSWQFSEKKSSLLGNTEYACLSHCSMAIMRHHAQGNSYLKQTNNNKNMFNWKLAYSFRSLVSCHHWNMAAGMVLEKYLIHRQRNSGLGFRFFKT